MMLLDVSFALPSGGAGRQEPSK